MYSRQSCLLAPDQYTTTQAPIKIVKLLVSELNNAPNTENTGGEDFDESGDEVSFKILKKKGFAWILFTDEPSYYHRVTVNGKMRTKILLLLQPMTLPSFQVPFIVFMSQVYKFIFS